MPRSMYAAEGEWRRRWDAATPAQRAALFDDVPCYHRPYTSAWADLSPITTEALIMDPAGNPVYPTPDDLPSVPRRSGCILALTALAWVFEWGERRPLAVFLCVAVLIGAWLVFLARVGLLVLF